MKVRIKQVALQEEVSELKVITKNTTEIQQYRNENIIIYLSTQQGSARHCSPLPLEQKNEIEDGS